MNNEALPTNRELVEANYVRIEQENAALRVERDEYKRKYELVRHDAAYQECCTLREKAEKERDSLREQLAAAHEQLRLCNIDQLNTQAELAAMTQERDGWHNDASSHLHALCEKQAEVNSLESSNLALQQRVTALSTALATLIREASRVADDHHRPRYTRLDESILSAKEAMAPTPRVGEETCNITLQRRVTELEEALKEMAEAWRNRGESTSLHIWNERMKNAVLKIDTLTSGTHRHDD